MRAAWLIGAGAVLAAGAAAATELRIENAAARLVVIPEARSDVQVSVTPGAARVPALRVRREGRGVVLDGGLRRRIDGCGGGSMGLPGRPSGPQAATVQIEGVGRVRAADLPLITARVPLNAQVSGGSAVWGRIGRTQSLRLNAAGCGDWTIESTGALALNAAGSGDVTVAAARTAEVSLAGSGDVRLGPVAGGLEADIAGSGDIRAASVAGPVNASIAGSGDVTIEGGRSGPVSASIVGSGDVRVAGVAQSVNASIMGSGDVRVGRSLGAVRRSVAGSGDVFVGR